MNRYILIRRLRGPAFLLLVGVVALLHQTGVVNHFWHLFWPLALILLGVLLLAERAALEMEGYPPPYSGCSVSGRPVCAAAGNRPPDRSAGADGTAIVPATLTISGTIRTEASHEQRTSLHTSGRRCAAPLRSAHAMAGLSRTAAGRLARAARCMKAQRHAMKAGYGGYAPRVPSIVGPIILVGVGIVGLLVVTGHIDSVRSGPGTGTGGRCC